MQFPVGVPRDHKNLDVFHRSRQLAIDVYQLTDALPGGERFGLTSQLRRAVTSISTNIVEGCGRDSPREYLRFIDIALASAGEVHHLLALAIDLRLLKTDEAERCRECSDHVARELQNLRKAIRQFDR